MVKQNEHPIKSRVIAGTPMYRFVNRGALFITGLIGIYHVGLGIYTYTSGLFEKYPQYFTVGRKEIGELGGINVAIRLSAAEAFNEKFKEELKSTAIARWIVIPFYEKFLKEEPSKETSEGRAKKESKRTVTILDKLFPEEPSTEKSEENALKESNIFGITFLNKFSTGASFKEISRESAGKESNGTGTTSVTSPSDTDNIPSKEATV